MGHLLDTHTLLWWLLDESRLPAEVLHTLDESPLLYWSPVNLWEIGLKMGHGGYHKLSLPDRWEESFPQIFRQYSVTELPIRPVHCRRIQSLPNHHRDPFDRMLAAQALVERLTLISADEIFDAYGVKRLW